MVSIRRKCFRIRKIQGDIEVESETGFRNVIVVVVSTPPPPEVISGARERNEGQ